MPQAQWKWDQVLQKLANQVDFVVVGGEAMGERERRRRARML